MEVNHSQDEKGKEIEIKFSMTGDLSEFNYVVSVWSHSTYLQQHQNWAACVTPLNVHCLNLQSLQLTLFVNMYVNME